MDITEHKGKALKLVGGDESREQAEIRKQCADLVAGFKQLTNGAELALRPGMLAQWKPGLKYRKTPDYGVPVVVVELLKNAPMDTEHGCGSVYFHEPLDLIAGFIDEEGDFCVLHYDVRRFEPYTGLQNE
ncbi:hypothetical protein DSC_00610 [Pseudoxanthomonas spadix BD-a59]|uniref:Uncharacterized protein n=2 Tax=Pseudoxanthomonas spadix TaxID=415229 RepID=G7USA6_PSEUP|nr:hypothetical protein DSC_00610 [Pseudoxanthomonas spadix BD-a59]